MQPVSLPDGPFGLVRSFAGHVNGILAVAFAPDGKRAFTIGRDGTLREWDLASGRELRCFSKPDRLVNAIFRAGAFFPAAYRAAIAIGPNLTVWDLESGNVLRQHYERGLESDVTCLAASPDQRHIVTGHRNLAVLVWRFENDSLGYVRQGEQCKGDDQGIRGVVISPDGKWFAAWASNEARVEDVIAGREKRGLVGNREGGIGCVHFHPDGRRILISPVHFAVRDLEALQAAVQPSSQRIRKRSPTGRLGPQHIPVPAGTLAAVPTVMGDDAALAPDGRFALLGTSNGKMYVYDLQSYRLTHRLETGLPHTGPMAISADGRFALTGASADAQLWALPRSPVALQLPAPGQPPLVPQPRPVCAEGKPELIAVAGLGRQDHEVKVLAWSPAGDQVLCCTASGVRLLQSPPLTEGNSPARGYPPNLETREVFYVSDTPLTRIHAAFSPDGHHVAGAVPKMIVLWHRATTVEVQRLMGPAADDAWIVRFMPNGRQLLSAGHDRVIHQWCLESGKEIHCYNGHEGAIFDLAVSADGALIASCGLEKSARLWCAHTGSELARLEAIPFNST